MENYVGSGSTCVLTRDDGVYCWGGNVVEYDENGNYTIQKILIFVELVQAQILLALLINQVLFSVGEITAIIFLLPIIHLMIHMYLFLLR